jgi:hypothetical protein
MPTSTTPAPAAPKAAAPAPLAPPDEQFWIRYSPHGEAPLAGVGSGALHVLVFGLLLLWGLWLAALFFPRKDAPVPVEPVQFVEAGGGGTPGGVGDNPGGPKKEGVDPGEPNGGHKTNPDENVGLKDIKKDDTPIQFDEARYVHKGPYSMGAFDQTNKELGGLGSLGPAPGAGAGGPGSGGGEGAGKGPGKGDKSGPGQTGNLSQRDKRRLRWSMEFNTRSGADYLAQLHSLGAVLAIPVGPDKFEVAEDLAIPGKRVEKDRKALEELNQIWWRDQTPQSVQSLVEAMGWRGAPPPEVIAFIPLKLEKDLAEKELAFTKAELTEDDIFMTKFRNVGGDVKVTGEISIIKGVVRTYGEITPAEKQAAEKAAHKPK